MSNPSFPAVVTEKKAEVARKRVAASLWRRGILDWKLEEHQLVAYKMIKEASKNPHNRFVLNASRRWGKSFLLAVIAFEYCITHPGAIVLMATATQKQTRDIARGCITPLMGDCPEEIKPKLKAQTGNIEFPNGAEIKLAGLDGGRMEKLRGITADMVILDEAGFVSDLAHAVQSVLSPMVATTGGQTVLGSNAPLTPGHDFVKVFTREAEREGFYLKQTVLDVKKFSKEDIDRFARNAGGYDSTTFRREYLCEFTADSNNAVLPEFGKMKLAIVKEIPRPEFFYPLVAMDLGYVDFTGVLFGHWNFKHACGVVEDELLLKGTNSENLVRACRAKELYLWGSEPLKPIVRVADGNAFTINDICSGHRYSVGAPMKDSLEAQVNAIRLDLEGFKLFIHPRCVNLIGQMEDATWTKGRNEFTRDTKNGHFDLVAALQYWVRHTNRNSNPFPPHYKLNVREMVIKDDRLNSSSLTTMKRLFSPMNPGSTPDGKLPAVIDVFTSSGTKIRR